MFLYISRKLGLSLKLDPRKLDRVLNSVSAFCHFQIHTSVKKNLGPSLKLGSDIWNWVWNSVQTTDAKILSFLTNFSIFFSFTKKKSPEIGWPEFWIPIHGVLFVGLHVDWELLETVFKIPTNNSGRQTKQRTKSWDGTGNKMMIHGQQDLEHYGTKNSLPALSMGRRAEHRPYEGRPTDWRPKLKYIFQHRPLLF
jgi:hypothetical protein